MPPTSEQVLQQIRREIGPDWFMINVSARSDYVMYRRKLIEEMKRVYLRVADNLEAKIATSAATPSAQFKSQQMAGLLHDVENEVRYIRNNLEGTMNQGIPRSVDAATRPARQMAHGIEQTAMDQNMLPNNLRGMGARIENRILSLNTARAEAYLAQTRHGATLSDRIWRLTERNHTQITWILQDAVTEGRDTVSTARDLRGYLARDTRVSERLRQRIPRLPKNASYEAFRLAQSEMERAYKESVYLAHTHNPGYKGIRWMLSVYGVHVVPDVCDDLADGEDGEGFWSLGNEPPHPHPFCFCGVFPVYPEPEELAAQLNDWARQGPGHYTDLDRWYEDYQKMPGYAPIQARTRTLAKGQKLRQAPGRGHDLVGKQPWTGDVPTNVEELENMIRVYTQQIAGEDGNRFRGIRTFSSNREWARALGESENRARRILAVADWDGTVAIGPKASKPLLKFLREGDGIARRYGVNPKRRWTKAVFEDNYMGFGRLRPAMLDYGNWMDELSQSISTLYHEVVHTITRGGIRNADRYIYQKPWARVLEEGATAIQEYRGSREFLRAMGLDRIDANIVHEWRGWAKSGYPWEKNWVNALEQTIPRSRHSTDIHLKAKLETPLSDRLYWYIDQMKPNASDQVQGKAAEMIIASFENRTNSVTGTRLDRFSLQTELRKLFGMRRTLPLSPDEAF